MDPNTNLEIRIGTLDPVNTARRGNADLPTWVKSAKNIYQTNGCYKGCPGRSVWYKGNAVNGAVNIDLTSVKHGDKRYTKPEELNYDHITIQQKAADVLP